MNNQTIYRLKFSSLLHAIGLMSLITGCELPGKAPQGMIFSNIFSAVPTTLPTFPNPPVQPTKGDQATPDSAGVFNSDGSLNAVNYRIMASNYGTAEMIAFRFGKDWHGYHVTDPSVLAPNYWERPHINYQLQTNIYEHGFYELGVPAYSQTTTGDFSSAMAQVGYVSDPNIARSMGGIDSISTYQQGRYMLSQVPQVAWVYNGGWNGTANDAGNGIDPVIRQGDAQKSKLVALTRTYGNSEEATHAFAIYQSGYVALLRGSNTDSDSYTAQLLPSNLVPTAASLTSQGEFALVTCWDTVNLKGVLAVVALGEKHPTGEHFDLPWSELYPGFRNSGEWTFAKYLGSIDLGINAPTEVEAVSDDFGWGGSAKIAGIATIQDQAGPGTSPLSQNQSLWSSFKTSGQNYHTYAHNGFAIVASRYEHKVVLVDLHPLFAKVQSMMFTDSSSFINNVVNGSGMAANQWPYAFSFDGSFAPKVAKTISFTNEVTAVSVSLGVENKALVATADGFLHTFDVDGLQDGSGSGFSTAEVSSIPLGKNITFIGHVRHFPNANQHNNGDVQHNYWILSRGDKQVSLISFQSGWMSPLVLKTLKDSRLVDPIGLDDNSNHGIQLDLLNIADYGAKKIHAYRYGVTYWITWLSGTSFGCGQAATAKNVVPFCDGTNGSSLFEYGGSYSTPSGAWVVNGQNVQ